MYAIAPYSDRPIFQINKHIGFDADVFEDDGVTIKEKGGGQGIDGKILSREIFEIDSLRPRILTFFVNSMGGDFEDGLDIFTAIAEAKTETECIIAGFAFSTSGWIPLAGDIVKCYDYSTWMCHLPYSTSKKGNNVLLDKVSDSIANIISHKSGRNGNPKKSPQEIKEMMKTKTYYDAQQLYDAGLINEVLNSSGEVKTFKNIEREKIVNEESIPEAKEQYIEYQKFFNKLVQKETIKIPVMAYGEKILNKLNLTEGSGDADVLEAIARIENKATIANREKVEAETKLSTFILEKETISNKLSEKEQLLNSEREAKAALQQKLDALEIKNADAEGRIAILNKEKEDAIFAEKEIKAKNLVKEYVGNGKIKNEEGVIKMWEDDAIANFDKTKMMLEMLSTNVAVPRPAAVLNMDGKTVDLGDGSDEAFRIRNREKRKVKG